MADSDTGAEGGGSALACPASVAADSRARKIWDETLASVPQGKGGAVYVRMLGEYCLAQARAEEAGELLRSTDAGKTKLIVSAGKQGGAKRSPLLDIVRTQGEQAARLAEKLGLLGDGDGSGPMAGKSGDKACYSGAQGNGRGLAPGATGRNSGASGGPLGAEPGAPGGGSTAVWGRRPCLSPSHGGQIPVYTSPAEETYETQAEYARRHGVSRPAVGNWKRDGFLVFQGDRVDVRASDAKLRDAGLGRFRAPTKAEAEALTADDGLQPGLQPADGEPVYTEQPDGAAPMDYGAAEDFLQRLLNGQFASIAVAGQVKENALAGVRVLEFLKTANSLVDLEVARDVLFEQARSFRDALMNWPTDIGPRLAAELGQPADKVTGALTRHVHTLLTDLGEPDPEFAKPSE
ncbi:MAG: hypothetical protein ACLGJC_20525 [Alphaproteobacteria bacterium]